MAEQFLSILRRSCHFDKKRFAGDIQRFHPTAQQPSSHQHLAFGHANGNEYHSQQPPSSKRQKLEELLAEEEKREPPHVDGDSAGEAEVEGKAEEEVEREQDEDDGDDSDDDEVDDEPYAHSGPSSPPLRPSSSIRLFGSSPADPPSSDAEVEAVESSSSPSSLLASELRALKLFRKQHAIHVHGTDVPPPVTSFTSLTTAFHLPPHILNNLTSSPPYGLGFDDPTPIQMQAIPIMLAGRECVGCSPTGTGKTAAFLLPILLSLLPPPSSSPPAPSPASHTSASSPSLSGHYPGIRALVIAPTKELASQIHRVCAKLTQGRRLRLLLLTKANSNSATFASGHDLVIATPLRLLHLLQQLTTIDVSALHHVVLDEADRLLDLGFLPQVDHILALLRQKQRQTTPTAAGFLLHLFSATLPHSLDALLPSLLFSPIKVTIAHRNTAQTAVEQKLVYVGDERGKLLALSNMRREGLPVPLLVFVQSGSRAQQLQEQLQERERMVGVAAMHGELTSAQRQSVLQRFRVGELSVLITTDLLSRGMDFVSVACVLNFDFPQSTVSYIHRIGRTGRAGKTGRSVTFFTAADRPLLRNVAAVIQHSGGEVPQWMMELHKVTPSKGRSLKEQAPAREPIIPKTKEEKETSEKRRLRAKKKAERRQQKQKQRQKQQQQQPPADATSAKARTRTVVLSAQRSGEVMLGKRKSQQRS